MAAVSSANLLAQATSPYLRQHADNPVHWREWSRTALDEARLSQRPVLLSVGYAACHWCHVMAHESFADPEVATVMNRLFVNIKVDREERPDIDQIYMAALNAMGEQGGWPMTMFLTPDGQPFWGGTYFPRHARYGRPGFIEVLEAVAATWRDRRDELDRSADALTRHVSIQLAPASDGGAGDIAVLRREHAQAILSMIDPEEGGLRGAPKFPNAPLMNLLRLSSLQDGATDCAAALVDSLRKMLAGGIYDHLGGGLCRYSTDSRWLVPHFEKMLYDNAQLIDLAGWAYAQSGDDLFRFRIEETIDWLARALLVEGGGFASSLDADSEGEEGRFYLWTRQQLVEALGSIDAERFLQFYQLDKPSEWEGDPILNRLGHRNAGARDTDPDMRAMKTVLLDIRNRRVSPAKDDKVLVDWNGMAIAALARAGRQFQRPDWIDLAGSAFRYVAESEAKGRLPHSILGNDRLFPCMSADYAAMIDAAVTLAEASDDPAFYIARARAWMEALDLWHGDEIGTGYYFTASDATDLPMRIRGDADDAMPSATARIIQAMTRLAMLSGDYALHDRAVAAAHAALGRTKSQRYGRSGIIHAAAIAEGAKKLVVVDAGGSGLVSVANRFPDPARTDLFSPFRTGGVSIAMPDGAFIDTDRPGAWLCIGQTCLPPVRTSSELEDLLHPTGT
jgi:uncharacterized protein YyaL (SSP411 family)